MVKFYAVTLPSISQSFWYLRSHLETIICASLIEHYSSFFSLIFYLHLPIIFMHFTPPLFGHHLYRCINLTVNYANKQFFICPPKMVHRLWPQNKCLALKKKLSYQFYEIPSSKVRLYHFYLLHESSSLKLCFLSHFSMLHIESINYVTNSCHKHLGSIIYLIISFNPPQHEIKLSCSFCCEMQVINLALNLNWNVFIY